MTGPTILPTAARQRPASPSVASRGTGLRVSGRAQATRCGAGTSWPVASRKAGLSVAAPGCAIEREAGTS